MKTKKSNKQLKREYNIIVVHILNIFIHCAHNRKECTRCMSTNSSSISLWWGSPLFYTRICIQNVIINPDK